MPEDREDSRSESVLQVKHRSATADEFVQLFARNVSAAGLFVRTQQPLQIGARLRFQILLSSGEPIVEGVGLVAWRRSPEQAESAPTSAAPAGVGLRFEQLDERSQRVVDKMLEARIESYSRFDMAQGAEMVDNDLASASNPPSSARVIPRPRKQSGSTTRDDGSATASGMLTPPATRAASQAPAASLAASPATQASQAPTHTQPPPVPSTAPPFVARRPASSTAPSAGSAESLAPTPRADAIAAGDTGAELPPPPVPMRASAIDPAEQRPSVPPPIPQALIDAAPCASMPLTTSSRPTIPAPAVGEARLLSASHFADGQQKDQWTDDFGHYTPTGPTVARALRGSSSPSASTPPPVPAAVAAVRTRDQSEPTTNQRLPQVRSAEGQSHAAPVVGDEGQSGACGPAEQLERDGVSSEFTSPAAKAIEPKQTESNAPLPPGVTSSSVPTGGQVVAPISAKAFASAARRKRAGTMPGLFTSGGTKDEVEEAPAQVASFFPSPTPSSSEEHAVGQRSLDAAEHASGGHDRPLGGMRAHSAPLEVPSPMGFAAVQPSNQANYGAGRATDAGRRDEGSERHSREDSQRVASQDKASTSHGAVGSHAHGAVGSHAHAAERVALAAERSALSGLFADLEQQTRAAVTPAGAMAAVEDYEPSPAPSPAVGLGPPSGPPFGRGPSGPPPGPPFGRGPSGPPSGPPFGPGPTDPVADDSADDSAAAVPLVRGAGALALRPSRSGKASATSIPPSPSIAVPGPETTRGLFYVMLGLAVLAVPVIAFVFVRDADSTERSTDEMISVEEPTVPNSGTVMQEVPAAAPVQAVKEPEVSRVEIESIPPEAEIWREDRLLGKAPVTLELPLGTEVVVRARKTGYAEISQTLLPRKSGTASIALELPRLPFVLRVETSPVGAQVNFLGEKTASPAEFTFQKMAGPQRVDVRKPGYRSQTRTVRPEHFREDETAWVNAIRVELQPLGQGPQSARESAPRTLAAKRAANTGAGTSTSAAIATPMRVSPRQSRRRTPAPPTPPPEVAPLRQ